MLTSHYVVLKWVRCLQNWALWALKAFVVENNDPHQDTSKLHGFPFISWTNTVHHFFTNIVWLHKMADCATSQNKRKNTHTFRGMCVWITILLLKQIFNHIHFITNFLYSPKRPIQNLKQLCRVGSECECKHDTLLCTGCMAQHASRQLFTYLFELMRDFYIEFTFTYNNKDWLRCTLT